MLPRDEAIKLAPVQEAEATNVARFANMTFRGITKKNEEVKKLPLLKDGDEPLHFNEEWERDFEMGDFLGNAAFGDHDFAAALGWAKFRSDGDFKAVRAGNNILITGTVVHRLADPYDFHPRQPGAEGALALQRYRGAKPFSFKTEWRQPVRAVVQVKGDKSASQRWNGET